MGKEALVQLIKQKDAMQKTIANLTQQLDIIDKNKHFEKGLVDREGFPRQDIDFGELSHYRNLKRRKAELNNDHAKLMKQIETNLFEYHATLPKVPVQEQQVKSNFSKIKQEKKPSQTIIQQQELQQKVSLQNYVIQYLTPFAKITLVEQNSPAQLGGLKVNDLLSQFSSVNIYTPDNIKQIPYHVREGTETKVIVMRPITQNDQQKYEKVFELKDKNNYAKLQLNLTPQKWSGRGLLGCKIDPL